MNRRLPKRLFYSLLIVLLWLGFVTEGSHALFADSAVLAGNTITTGTVDLLVSNTQNGSSSTYADSRPGFPVALAPGQTDEHFFILKNASASSVPLSISMIATQAQGDHALPNYIQLEFTPVDSSGAVSGAPVSVLLSTALVQYTNLGVVIEQGKTQRFRVHTLLDTVFGGQGVNVGYDLMFTGTQTTP